MSDPMTILKNQVTTLETQVAQLRGALQGVVLISNPGQTPERNTLVQNEYDISLTPATLDLPSNASGSTVDYSLAYAYFVIKINGVDTSGAWTFSRVNGTGVTFSTLSGNRIDVTAMANDTGYVDITATRSGYQTIQRRLIITKAKQGLGAPTLQAQYSVDGSTAWHSTPVAADVYMRTSADGGTTWSAAVKVKGEQGATGPFTDFRYAAYPSATTAPTYTAGADNPGANWFDTPQTLSPGYFQWMIQSDWSGSTRLSAWTAPVRLSGETGTSGTRPNPDNPSALWPFSDMPAMPDNAAGVKNGITGSPTSAMFPFGGAGPTESNFGYLDTSVWNGTGTITNGILSLVKTVSNGGILRLGNGSFTPRTIIMRVFPLGSSMTINDDVTSVSISVTPNQWNVISASGIGGNGFIDIEGFVVGTTLISHIYIGDGTYASKNVTWAEDFSGGLGTWGVGGTGGGSLTVTNGVLQWTKANASSFISKSGVPVKKGQTVRIKGRISAGTPGSNNINLWIGTYDIYPTVAIDGSWFTALCVAPGDGNGNFGIYMAPYGGSEVYSIQIDYIDISDGIYGPIADASGNGRTLSLQPGAVRKPGPGGLWAIDTTFGGAYGSEVGLTLGSADRTMLVWFSRSDTSTAYVTLVEYGAPSVTNNFRLSMVAGYFTIDFYGISLQWSNSGFLDGKWHHFVGVVSGGTIYLYVDGLLRNSGAIIPNTTVGAGLTVGTDDARTSHFPGLVAEPRIYPRALSASEVMWLYANPGVLPVQAVTQQIAAQSPKYMGSWAIAPQGNVQEGFWFHYKGTTNATFTNGGIYVYLGGVWVADGDKGHAGWALEDILANVAAGGSDPVGWTFISSLISDAILVNQLTARQAFLDKITGVDATFSGRMAAASGSLGAYSSELQFKGPQTFQNGTVATELYNIIIGALPFDGDIVSIDGTVNGTPILFARRPTTTSFGPYFILFDAAFNGLGSYSSSSYVYGTVVINKVFKVSRQKGTLRVWGGIVSGVRDDINLGGDIGEPGYAFNRGYISQVFSPLGVVAYNGPRSQSDYLIRSGVISWLESTSTYGYQKYSDGTLIQWKYISLTSALSQAVTLPYAFADTNYVVVISIESAAMNGYGQVKDGKTTSGFNAFITGTAGINGTYPVSIFAIGRWY